MKGLILRFKSYLDESTAEIAKKIREYLQITKISQRIFAESLLNMKQANFSSLLSQPLSWSQLSKTYRDRFLIIYLWLNDPFRMDKLDNTNRRKPMMLKRKYLHVEYSLKNKKYATSFSFSLSHKQFLQEQSKEHTASDESTASATSTHALRREQPQENARMPQQRSDEQVEDRVHKESLSDVARARRHQCRARLGREENSRLVRPSTSSLQDSEQEKTEITYDVHINISLSVLKFRRSFLFFSVTLLKIQIELKFSFK